MIMKNTKKPKRTIISIKSDVDDLVLKKENIINKTAELVVEYLLQYDGDNDIEINKRVESLIGKDFTLEDKVKILMAALATIVIDEV